MEIKKYKLGEIGRILNGSTPSTLDAENYDGDIVWVTPKDLSDQKSKYFYKGERNITQKGYDSCSTQMIPANNILMSSRAPIGLLAINKVDCCTNQGFKNIILDKTISDVDYMYYYLKYHIKEVEALGSGTTFKEVSKISFEKYEISLPDLDIQQKIASVLSSLDSKIALNRCINAKLKQMAKRLYDYWFVQFDFPNAEGKPYKSSGGKMVYNATLKREIPEGWEVVQFQNLCNIKRGASPRPIDDFMDKTKMGMPWVKISDATSADSPFLTHIKEFIIKDGVSKSVHVIPGTLIVSNSASPGIPKFIQIDACVHDGWLVITDYDSNYKFYLYYTIEILRSNLLKLANGSIFKNLKTDYLKEYACVNPNKDVLCSFHKQVSKLMRLLLVSVKEIEKLTALRDKLLPLLMNGQVTVK